MARKTHAKVTSATPEPAAEVKRENIRSPEFVSIYANDIQVQTSPWDMRFILGEITTPATAGEPVVTIRQLGELRISPQLAKRLTMIMVDQLGVYEKRFGQIPEPPKA